LANSLDPRIFSLYQDVFRHLPVNETVSGQDTKLTMSAKNEYLKILFSMKFALSYFTEDGESEWDVVKGIIHFYDLCKKLTCPRVDTFLVNTHER
jgi:hypothetical protein